MNIKRVKDWIDANFNDGDDRTGAKNDWIKMTPDQLEEAVMDCIGYFLQEEAEEFSRAREEKYD